MSSKAFRKGFLMGFTSPLLILPAGHIKRSTRFSGSVEKAWKEVGNDLAVATEQEGKRLGKAPGTKKPRTHVAA